MMSSLLNQVIIILVCIEVIICTQGEDLSCDTDNELKTISLVEIDINQFINGNEMEQKSIANIVDEQLHQIGSFRIKNHGISADLINKLFLETKQFFEESNEYKEKYKVSGLLGANGWEPLGTLNRGKIIAEGFSLWFPQLLYEENKICNYCPQKLCQTIIKYTQKTSNIISILQDIYALALDLNINQFKLDMTDINNTNIDNEYFNKFRLWNYLDLNSFISDHDEFNNEYRLSSHTDAQQTTLLSYDIDGLQIKLERIDNKWYNVNNNHISDDSLIVNIGEVIEMNTSGYWVAARHRVSRLSGKRRISIANFFGPNMNRIITQLTNCNKCRQNRNETIMKQYKLPISYREYARKRYGGIYNNYEHEKLLPFWLS